MRARSPDRGVKLPSRPDSEVERLRAQAEVLDEQVKQLVKTEQRLFRSQKELDRQLTRMHAVNHFALEAATAFEPHQILECAMKTLASQLALSQGLGMLSERASGGLALVGECTFVRRGFDGDGLAAPRLAGCRVAVDAVLGGIPHEPVVGSAAELAAQLPELEPLLDCFAQLLGDASRGTVRTFVVIPLFGHRHQELVGAVLMRAPSPQRVGFHDKLPDASDLPFLRLFASHLESTLENALLHQRLASMARSLELRVAERTAALSALNAELEDSLHELRDTQGQLFQAGKMAAVGTLVAGLSHELNTPLSIILGYAQSLLDQVGGASELHAPLHAIERQARRCSQLVGALLDFSRFDPATRSTLAPEELIERVRELASSRARCDEIELRVVLPARPLPPLLANATELESALLNLVNNAMDAVALRGRVVIGARALAVEERDGVEFRVEDSGGGIPKDIEPWIFDPFFTTKPVGKGTGLGLALTRRIVEAHEGRIEVDSKLGAGTTMRAWIPVLHARDLAAATAAAAEDDGDE